MRTSEITHTADPTRITVERSDGRARVGLVMGAFAPRLIDREAATARVALAAAHMLLLDGDDVLIEIEVGDGCTLEIEDIGGTVAYPGASSFEVAATIGVGARLLWRGLPFVVTTGATARRRTSFTLAAGASLLVRETLVLGRHGEVGGAIASGITVTRDGDPALIERLEADGAVPGAGVLGPHRVLDSVIAIGYRPPSSQGDLLLEEPGAVSRYLGDQAHRSALDAVWTSWRAALVSEPHISA
jgi:urease accessory protein